MTSSWSRTCSASGWAKIVRIAAATISAEPLGTWASTLRRKWTRQRCQAAPIITAAMACLRPVWASEMTSCGARPARGPSASAGTRSRTPRPRCRRRRSRGPRGARRRSRRWRSRPPGTRPGPLPPCAPPGPCSRWRRGTRRGTSVSARSRSRERGDLGVEVGADPRHLGLGDPGVRAQRVDQVVDLAGADVPVHVGLHHHREQRLVDPAAPLQQRREERPRAQLGDRQLQIPRGRGQRPGPVPVALRRAGLGALVRARRRSPRSPRPRSAPAASPAPRRGSRSTAIGGLQRVEQLEQGRLGQGHRVCSLREFLGGFSRSLTRWPLNAQEAGPELHHSTGRDRRRADHVHPFAVGALVEGPGTHHGPGHRDALPAHRDRPGRHRRSRHRPVHGVAVPRVVDRRAAPAGRHPAARRRRRPGGFRCRGARRLPRP